MRAIKSIPAILIALAAHVAFAAGVGDPSAAIEVLSPALADTVDSPKPVRLRAAHPDDYAAAIELDLLDDTVACDKKDPTHLEIVHRRRSKGLGTTVDTKVASLWLENGALYLQWEPEQGKAAVDELKYAGVRIQTADRTNVAVCQFVQPDKLTLKLRAAEVARLTAPPATYAKLKLEIPAPPQGWEAAPAADGRALELRQGKARFSFQLAAGEALLRSLGNAPALPPATAQATSPQDAHHRLTIIEREIRANQEDLKRRQATLTRASNSEERASVNRAIRIVENRIRHQKELRVKFASEAGIPIEAPPSVVSTTPRGAILRATLPNGVCLAEVTLEDDR